MRRGTLKLVTRKAACQALGGRVLIGGWARAARQGSKLWEARVEPPVGPARQRHSADYTVDHGPTAMHLDHHHGDKQEARNMLFSLESRCQFSIQFPFPIPSLIIPRPRFQYTQHGTAGRADLATRVSNHSLAPLLAGLAQTAASSEKRNECNPDSLPTQAKVSCQTTPFLSTPGICTP